MLDFLDTLARDAKETVRSGYYEHLTPKRTVFAASLKNAITQTKTVAVITEVKAASPSAGTIRKHVSPKEIVSAMARGGAAGISVLTEPKHFNGSLSYLAQVREAVKLPILMKDFIMSPNQLDAAQQVGANAVLLIQALFDRGYCEFSLDDMIEQAHSRKLEVLLETHNVNEFQRAVCSNADLIGINNRDLGTLKVDLNVTKGILEKNVANGKVVVSESGINSAADIRFLREYGAKAFLVGSAIMLADDVEEKVKELVNVNLNEEKGT
jgi:indole-3-glycerol phosphate synthase